MRQMDLLEFQQIKSKWKPYPKYKYSDVEFLGEIPELWETKPLKRLVDCPINKEPGRELPFVALEHIISSIGRLVPGFEWEPKLADNYAVFQSNDVLFGKLRPYLRKYLHVDRVGCCPTELLVFRPKEGEYISRYLFFLVNSKSFVSLAEATSYGTKMPRTSWEKLGPSHMCQPPLSEQESIVKYLDYETSKIDSIVKKKEYLIRLLEEKRAVLISLTVTKGLNLNTEMKDSGIEWLGEIPAHWEIKPLKYSVQINPEALGENIDANYILKYVDIGNVSLSGLLSEPEEMMFQDAPSRARRIVKSDDVIVSTVRTYLKAITRFPNPEPNLIVSTGFAVLRPNSQIDSSYLYYTLRSNQFIDAIMAHSEGIGYPAINSSDLGRLPFWFPLILEQRTIGTYLNQETKKIDTFITKIHEALKKLKEYRTALISAAVTGKIDVRGEVT